MPAEPALPAMPLDLHQRLKAATRDRHERLDKALMAGNIFANTGNFCRFLRVQSRFHQDIRPLYEKPELAAHLPDLKTRCRHLQIVQDLQDLGASPPPHKGKLDANTPLAEALGWLYVAEGSNLGAAVLFKMASKQLGLGAGHGARHLAAHPDGNAAHWRTFTTALNKIDLHPGEQIRVLAAANAAFATVQEYVSEEFS